LFAILVTMSIVSISLYRLILGQVKIG